MVMHTGKAIYLRSKPKSKESTEKQGLGTSGRWIQKWQTYFVASALMKADLVCI